MCGRYYRRSDEQRIAEAFGLGHLPANFVLAPWDYNIAPTTFQPVIRNSRTGEREMVLMRWGMVPFFAKSAGEVKGLSTINAKAETLMSRAMWRIPFERRRCLVPADGFYEWRVLVGQEEAADQVKKEAKKEPKKEAKKSAKEPYGFSLKSGEPFAFGGLWDAWKDPANGEWLQSFAIITTEPNELTAKVHDRMPLIIAPEDYDRWLDRESGEPPVDLVRAFPAEEMKAARVSRDVGNVKKNGPELLNDTDEP